MKKLIAIAMMVGLALANYNVIHIVQVISMDGTPVTQSHEVILDANGDNWITLEDVWVMQKYIMDEAKYGVRSGMPFTSAFTYNDAPFGFVQSSMQAAYFIESVQDTGYVYPSDISWVGAYYNGVCVGAIEYEMEGDVVVAMLIETDIPTEYTSEYLPAGEIPDFMVCYRGKVIPAVPEVSVFSPDPNLEAENVGLHIIILHI